MVQRSRKAGMTNFRSRLEGRIASGQDSALLRFILGCAFRKDRDHLSALHHLREAVKLDPDYSAAWAMLAKTYAEAGKDHDALDACRIGTTVADRNGDIQASRQMRVFLKRLETRLQKCAPDAGSSADH